MVSSISATERIKLWDQFSGPVDQETIKSDFLRKVHCKNPPFRYKVKAKPRICAEIPQMVEYHYEHPPPLMPSLRDVLRYERVHKRTHSAELSHPELCTEVDRNIHEFRQAQRKIRRFESDLTADDSAPNNDETMQIDEIKDEDVSESTENVQNVESNGSKDGVDVPTHVIGNETEDDVGKTTAQIVPEVHKSETDDVKILNGNSDDDLQHSDETNDKPEEMSADAKPVATCRTAEHRRRKRHTSTKSVGFDCAEMLDLATDAFKAKWEMETIDAERIDAELKHLDLDVIKALAFRQLQQILSENNDLVAKYQAETANKAIKDALKSMPVKIVLPSQLLTSDDIARIAEQFASSSSDIECDERRDDAIGSTTTDPHPVAMQRNINATGFDHLDSDTEKALVIARRLEQPLRESKIRARAVLTPVTDILEGKRWYTEATIDDSIFMRYRSLTIGTDYGCQLQLKPARRCARLSKHHASIFFDEVRPDQATMPSTSSKTNLNFSVSPFRIHQVTKVYELLNYSEFGSEVNGQLYSCDFTEYPQLNENRLQDVNGFYENIRNILDKKRGVHRIDYKPDPNAK